MKLYLGYGSNLNIEQMQLRCPKAKPYGTLNLKGWKLVFKGVADIIEDANSSVPVGIWKITDDCEEALDRYEGYPTLYGKIYFKTPSNERMLSYKMNSYNINPPMEMYYNVIKQGYKDFGLDMNYLTEALEHSYNHDTGNGRVPQRFKHSSPKLPNIDNRLFD
tara:strand:- start:174 stop:662 length:489 start_codon:yes stop_codon:yes gene_type:complete